MEGPLVGFESARPTPEAPLRYVHRDAARHVHRDAARHGFIRTLPGMLVLTSLTPEGAAVRRACNRKEKVVESYGMRS
ncbi:hypothetical protein RchiOBHm_Chr6g0307121 [Rosa chinensis]|uniref:Uncharacterized protein n=1 Tax=Rosa chinensis TaxID=74649 RepID=A0A2P6Q0B5_ROSCH|nr:hypothetical protein RchiOBHm_Chr6g0307121 [Rosa chinensis]